MATKDKKGKKQITNIRDETGVIAMDVGTLKAQFNNSTNNPMLTNRTKFLRINSLKDTNFRNSHEHSLTCKDIELII